MNERSGKTSALGEKLFTRAGRGLALTEVGPVVKCGADESQKEGLTTAKQQAAALAPHKGRAGAPALHHHNSKQRPLHQGPKPSGSLL